MRFALAGHDLQSRNMSFDHGTHVVRAKDIPRSQAEDIFCVQRTLLSIVVYALCALLVLAVPCWHVNMLTSMLDVLLYE